MTSTNGRSSSDGPLRREPMLPELVDENRIRILRTGLNHATQHFVACSNSVIFALLMLAYPFIIIYNAESSK